MKNATRLGLLFPLLVFGRLCAAGQTDLGEVAFRQALLDLGTDLRLMCVAAHPDDEDGATLARYRYKYGIKTFAVIATRGEGGQNETGPELYEELAVIRTREMMRAAAIIGAELRFLNLPEFGYSKTAEETFSIWGREEALSRLVRVIREVRPDVIITHHDATTKGHGHHQAIGATLIEAFEAAGDPAVFPGQVAEGLEPWQAARLYIRTGEETPGSVTVDISELDPLRGKTYAEMAAEALAEHQSQGMGYSINRDLTGRPRVFYELVKSAPSLVFVGDVPAPGGVLFEGLVDRVTRQERELSRSTADRETLKAQLMTHAGSTTERSPLQRAWRAAACAAELRLTATPNDSEVVPGQTVTIRANLTDFGSADARVVTFSVQPTDGFNVETAAPVTVQPAEGHLAEAEWTLTVPEGQPPTLPAAEHVFDTTFLRPQFEVVGEVDCGTTGIELRRPVLLDIAPSIGIGFADTPRMARHGVDTEARFDVVLTNHAPGANSGTLILSASPGLALSSQREDVQFDAEGAQKVIPVVATIAEDIAPRDYYLTAMRAGSDQAVHAKLCLMDLQVPETVYVGVIQSYDDTFIRTLERVHISHGAVSVADFTPERLDRFTTIIVDIRAYLVRPDLVANNAALLDYVHRGGNVIVMYQKKHEWEEDYAPYPIHVSHNRVTVEEAPIKLLAPEHPLFHVPNSIEPGDWDNWRQERGLYFPDRWDARYTPLIHCADPGEDPPPGSCLITRYGEGIYLYTALGWYRQLRELHPGALRVFANMLALGAEPGQNSGVVEEE